MQAGRDRAAAGLSGVVVELGFGSGLNVASYPPEVTLVQAVEPSEVGRRLSETRVAEGRVPVAFAGLRGESLELPDDSCDGALCTFTLCTIPGVEQALDELRRVLRPGGRFHFLEHGLAPDAGVAALAASPGAPADGAGRRLPPHPRPGPARGRRRASGSSRSRAPT